MDLNVNEYVQCLIIEYGPAGYTAAIGGEIWYRQSNSSMIIRVNSSHSLKFRFL